LAWACGKYGGEESSMQDSGEEIWGETPIWMSRRRWENNIKMDLKEMGSEGVD
jgi:hypothetical protein